ncbi:MAG TPA: ABC transporter permease [Candidatus Limnocylindria bacterium]|jgi:ABC-2 type transport system permease protein|nr:ABC transporter permease [Candidatus Limnocylindria bacterium]
MTVLAREMRASFAFVERNFNLSKRYWGWEVAFMVYSVAGALAVTLIGQDQGSARLILSLMIGATFWNYLSVVFSIIAEQISWERWEGTLEYTMMAPVRRISQLLGSTIFAILWGIFHMAVVLTVLILFFGIDLSHADLLTAGVLMLIGSASIIGIGMMAATLPLIWVERGDQMVFVIQSLLLLISGVYYSVTILPEWMQVISAFSPATYILDGVRQGLIDGVPITDLGGHVLPLIVMAFVFIPLGVYVFARAERYAKRTGKLKRVG